ncbi:MAG: hypothetical protein U0V73_08955 [Acidimicrobiia bacterium]
MSSLWTPSGEHTPGDSGESGPAPATPPGGPAAGAPTEAELAAAEELARMRAELAATPVVDIVANHVIGLWQLAILHLGLDGDGPQNLAEASLAIDAVGAIVDGLGDRMQDHAQPLRDALAQLRLAYVQVAQTVRPGAGGE